MGGEVGDDPDLAHGRAVEAAGLGLATECWDLGRAVEAWDLDRPLHDRDLRRSAQVVVCEPDPPAGGPWRAQRSAPRHLDGRRAGRIGERGRQVERIERRARLRVRDEEDGVRIIVVEGPAAGRSVPVFGQGRLRPGRALMGHQPLRIRIEVEFTLNAEDDVAAVGRVDRAAGTA